MLDAPGVGDDLQDHLQVRLIMRCSQRVTLNDIVHHPLRRALAGARYAAFRKGPLTIAAGTSGAFFKTDPRLASPDIQIHFIPFSTDKMGEKLHSFSGLHRLGVPACGPRAAARCGSGAPTRPRRRKSASTISPPKPTAAPISMASSILRKILAAPALKPYVVDEAYPGSKVTSDDDILAYSPPDRQYGLPSDLDLPDGQRSRWR